MKTLPHFLPGNLANDRGREMMCYKELMRRLDIDLWFANLHAPCQRGSD